MFEHFDERARTCVVLAQQEARRLGHEEIGTVHLLLGVAGVEPELLGVEIQAVRAAVVALQGSTPAPIRNWLPFSPGATAALEEGANRQALSRGHTVIDAAHLLLALMEAGGGAARALREAGAAPSAVRERAIAAAGSGPQSIAPPAAGPAHMPAAAPGSPARDAGSDHAEDLRNGDPVPVVLGMDARGIGDLGNPHVDARLLELLLVQDTIAGRLLRAHGIDEILLREVFGTYGQR